MRWIKDNIIRTYAALAILIGYFGFKVLCSGHVRYMPVPQWVGILFILIALLYVALIIRRTRKQRRGSGTDDTI